MLLSKNCFGKFWNYDPWRPQFWPEPKKWPKWFRNNFSRAFERCLSFFSTATRSRDHGGGGVQTPPPPPSRRWEIQRPSRARVKGVDTSVWHPTAGASFCIGLVGPKPYQCSFEPYQYSSEPYQCCCINICITINNQKNSNYSYNVRKG